MRRLLVSLILVSLLAVPAAASAAPSSWVPGFKAARAYARQRTGIIGFALRTPTRRWTYNAKRDMPAASTFKSIALTAYLLKAKNRDLNSHDKSLLHPMITRSSDSATDQVVKYVGWGLIRKVASEVPMYRFHPNTKIWGRSLIDSIDMANYMLKIDTLMPARHRAYGLYLLASVIPPQRWGIGQAQPKGWHLYFKSGWGLGTGWVDHQVVLLTRGKERVSIAVLTSKITPDNGSNGSHPYGKATLKGLFRRLLKGLDKAPVGSVR